jgi:hypothetical protein
VILLSFVYNGGAKWVFSELEILYNLIREVGDILKQKDSFLSFFISFYAEF